MFKSEVHTEDVPGNYEYQDLSQFNNATFNSTTSHDEPEDCVGNWTAFSECSVTCGMGVRSREYFILQDATTVYVDNYSLGNLTFGGYELHGAECDYEDGYIQLTNCTNNGTLCPVDCVGIWSDWSKCSEECDGGTQKVPNITVIKIAFQGPN